MLYRTLDQVNVREVPSFAMPVRGILPAGVTVVVYEIQVHESDSWAKIADGLWCPVCYRENGGTKAMMEGAGEAGSPVLLRLDGESSREIARIVKMRGVVVRE